MAESVYQNYAIALFSLTKEKDGQEYLSALRKVEKDLSENPDFLAFLSSYSIPLETRLAALSKVYEPLKLAYLPRFLGLLVQHHRIRHLNEVEREFAALVNEEHGILEGIVYSASKLEEKDIKRIEKAFERKLGKKVALKNRVDEKILGGVKVALDGKVYDGSIRNRLLDLEKQLLAGGSNL